jgi:hypothetical protein
MTNPLITETSGSTETMDRFAPYATVGAEILTSPAGRAIARQFTFNRAAVISATVYSIADRHRIVSELRLGLTAFYVHLERKKAIYGFDPIRALGLLEPSINQLTDSEFHQSIVDLVARTRDRHLMFFGRAPIGLSAVLPFTVEQCWQGPDVQYAVTKIAPGFTPKQLRAGALVTHWNGIPIQRFLALNANVFDGGNEAASLARSIAFLTTRPLDEFAAPLEEWVDMRFTLAGMAYEERFTWKGFDASQTPVTPSVGRNRTGFGGDLQLMYLQHSRRVRFAPQSFDPSAAPASAPAGNGVPTIIGSDPAGNFEYGSVTTGYGTFGYVRLWQFSADTADDIANSFIRVLPQLPRKGLIIDLRGNHGGYIAAGERVLQLFTPRQITPSRFQFRVTPATRSMVSEWDDFKIWLPSVDEAIATGEPYSQGYSIEGSDADANQLGQYYFGPVVLIGDALAFSTADIFTAGFIDHEIGKVICTDENMAAAGGNNWRWDIVRLYNPDFHLDPALKAAFDAGTLSPEVRDAFNRGGASLSANAVVSGGQPQYDGIRWIITDGALTHVVRSLPQMGKVLYVYLAKGSFGLADLPGGIIVSLTMRRCVRVEKNEGRLLEDLGIHPDLVYHMTLRDVMEKNQDLNIRASLELSRMPAYDLDVAVVLKDSAYTLVCRTLQLTSVEAFAGEMFLAAAPATDGKPVELSIISGRGSVEVRGLRDNRVVARRFVSLPAPSA